MKHFLTSIIIIVIYSTSYSQQIDINVLKKDPKLIQYKKVMNELRDGQLSGRYVLPNDTEVMKSFSSNPDKENLKKLLIRKGMKNANEYVDKMFLQTTLMFEFLKKHPEISKLEASKKQEVIGKLIFD